MTSAMAMYEEEVEAFLTKLKNAGESSRMIIFKLI
jgi:hypothetical protein